MEGTGKSEEAAKVKTNIWGRGPTTAGQSSAKGQLQGGAVGTWRDAGPGFLWAMHMK